MAKKRKRVYGDPETTGTVTLEVSTPKRKRKPKPRQIDGGIYRLVQASHALRIAKVNLAEIDNSILGNEETADGRYTVDSDQTVLRHAQQLLSELEMRIERRFLIKVPK